MKILLVDNYDSFTYNIVEILRQLSYTDISLFYNDTISSTLAAQYDKIILSPGPATPSESGHLLNLIQDLAPTHPILGICLGHQAIAEAFGAHLYNMSQPMHGRQTQLTITAPDPLLHDMHGEQVGLYHSWVVDPASIPPQLQVTSVSHDRQHIMSLRHQHYPVFGWQFHPESHMTHHGKILIQRFLEYNL